MQDEKKFLVNILDILPQETVYISFDDDLRYRFFDDLKKTNWTCLAREFKVSRKNLNRYPLGRRSFSLALFHKFLSKSNFDLSEFQGKAKLKMKRTNHYIRLGPFVEIDEDWVYLAELIRGDGHLAKTTWTIDFVNKEKKLIDAFRKFFVKRALDCNFYLSENEKGIFHLVCRSAILATLFSKIFLIPFGKKQNMQLPLFYFSNKTFLVSAIRGFFDSEGSVSNGSKQSDYPKRISMCMYDKSCVQNYKKALDKLGLYSCFFSEKDNKKYSLIIGRRYHLIKFLKLIKPLHPIRVKKLKEVLKSYKSSRFQGTNLTRVLQSISKGNNRRSQISQNTGLSLPNLSFYLTKLQKLRLIYIIKKIYTNKGGYFLYDLTKEGAASLKKDLNWI